jgi:glycerophosphoryl diester phosphodiesterase
VKWADGKKY